MSERSNTSDTDTPTVYGGPTKRFFVSMLTRDIDLSDAILDLVDNCIDGAMRQRKDRLAEATPFEGFEARLNMSSNKFEITDNCGGIPEEFINDAFSLGRPNIQKDGEIPSIGMYGIGMKRAIFKMGSSATVTSNSSDGFFEVTYSSEWLNPDNDKWDLPISRSSKKETREGVDISVTELKSDIATHFNNDSFVNELKNKISEHFGYLMQEGFSIFVNDTPLSPKTLTIYNAVQSETHGIRPYDYEARVGSVDIKVTIGFFRKLAKEEEIESETESPKSEERAGISVVCNDRLVLLSDRSLKTGWGEGGVPRYHPQFRAIAGLIILSSNHAEELPISTTKRDLDAGSEVFLKARQAAIEGLKTFTDFTNKWKGMEDETNKFFAASSRSDVKTNVALARTDGRGVRGGTVAKKYLPDLPMPENKNPRKRISFVRKEQDIKLTSKYLFDDQSQHPSLVGGECFDRILNEAKKA